MRLTSLLAAVAFVAVALPSLSAGDEPGKGKGKGKGAETFAKLDADKDGRITKAEWDAGKAMRKNAEEDRFDSDKDGDLSKAEKEARRTAHQAEFKAKHPEAFAKADTNGDGSLSKEEAKAVHEARKNDDKPDMFTRLDADKDGTVTREEWQSRKDHGKGHGKDDQPKP